MAILFVIGVPMTKALGLVCLKIRLFLPSPLATILFSRASGAGIGPYVRRAALGFWGHYLLGLALLADWYAITAYGVVLITEETFRKHSHSLNVPNSPC